MDASQEKLKVVDKSINKHLNLICFQLHYSVSLMGVNGS